jgi:hypothetical protein
VTGQAARIRALTAERYGRDPREIEAELSARMDSQPKTQARQVGETERAV